MQGFQYLENNFFNLCKTRKIYKISQLLLIYLRGLYFYFGKPTFYWKDERILHHLGIAKNTLRQARELLKERGVIDYITQAGRGRAVCYLILKTELAPELKGSKINPFVDNSRKGSEVDRKGSYSDPFLMRKKGQKLTPKSYIESKPLEYIVDNLLKFKKPDEKPNLP
jgi:hypothetical protein